MRSFGAATSTLDDAARVQKGRISTDTNTDMQKSAASPMPIGGDAAP
jgi:hypothetical protein